MTIQEEKIVEYITAEVFKELEKYDDSPMSLKKRLPVAVSARHVHLSKNDVETLFGKGYKLTKWKALSQTGQFACEEKVSLATGNKRIDNVRILGPCRKETQVEIALSDARRLKTNTVVRNSGELLGSAPISIEGPRGSVRLQYGCIIAARHIHMTPEDAEAFGVKHNQRVSVKFFGEKGGIMDNVTCKVDASYVLEMHIDVDDANAFKVSSQDVVEIVG